jgi:undecaprenyl-diphosphatase
MPLLILIAVALLAGLAAGALAWRFTRPRRALHAAEHAGEAAGEAVAESPGLRRRLLHARLDPERATGLALTLALVVIVAGGVVLGVLAYLVRSKTGLVEWDRSVAVWGNDHATAFTTSVIRAISDAAHPWSIAGMAIVLGVVLTLRTRTWAPALFLLCVVGGNSIITTTIKHLADRVRPDLNSIAATLGPSFPSGHSSHSAAFFAAAALLLGRHLHRHGRAVLAGLAVGLAVAVAASRVMLAEHWLSDVVAGLALGWAWFAVCAIAFGGRLLTFGAGARAARTEAQRAAQPV